MELHPDLEQILLRKSFSELTTREREKVAPFFDQTTYEQYRLVVLGSKILQRDTPLLHPNLEQDLLVAFDQRYAVPIIEPEPMLSRVMQHRIPSWLAGGIAAMLCLLFMILFEGETTSKLITKTAVVYQTDTVYVEVPIPMQAESRSLQQSKIVSKPNFKREEKREITTKPIAQNTKESTIQDPAAQSLKSSSVQRDPDLFDLVVKVY